ncbi:cell division protein FtsL [Aquincola tertiaricarbonis]|uniref:Cell division protein FtsL n=1 Tax=Aquincola tertiaricarbonis TaxID=391953 RepID=A0ABY4S8A3_AQUTE|nr:cell division protein FtsL [Aquincola tertiaricarbonis]URI09586.1 cell division protein FtsL [Aquincola tertiaricarbonis]
MTRLNIVLLAALLASCLYLVKTTYDTRRLFNEIDRAKTLHAKLEIDYKRLEAERQAQATHLRVEKVARDRLQMRTATAALTQYVTDGSAPVVAPAASAPTSQAEVR